MFFTDIEVDLPEHRRVAWNKNKPYVTKIFSRKGKNSEDDCHVVGIATGRKSIQNTVDKRTKVIKKTAVNHEEADRRLSKSGFFYIVSNREMTPSEIYMFYRHRDVVEKDFRLSRSEEDLSKTYAQSNICFEAKTFLGFLCSVVRSDILDTMAPYFRQYASETTQSVISEMGKIKLDKIGKSLALISPLTNRQKQIMSFYSLSRKNIDALMDEFKTIGFPNQQLCVCVDKSFYLHSESHA